MPARRRQGSTREESIQAVSRVTGVAAERTCLWGHRALLPQQGHTACLNWRTSVVRRGCHHAQVPRDLEPRGTLDLQDLHHRWEQSEQLRSFAQQSVQRWDRRVVCPRTVDEGQVGGHRVYAAAERFLSTADENHDALLSLLKHHGATPTAPWNLLRPSFESAFYALWLLNPEDSVERRRRAIRIEWLDDEQAQKYQAVALGNREMLAKIGVQPETVRLPEVHENMATYKSEADATGLRYDTKQHRRHVTYRPHQLNVEALLGDLLPNDPLSTLVLQTTWKTLSGIQHAQGNALLRVSDHSSVGHYPGGQRLLLTMNDGAFYLACLATTMLRGLGWSRYGACHRAIRSNEPVDLAAMRDLLIRFRSGASG